MELNLRKTRKLESAIQTHLDSTRVDTTAVVRILGTLEEGKASVEAQRKASLAKLPERETLLRLRYKLRREIEKKNEELGINELIGQKVLLNNLSKAEFISSAGPEGLEFDDQFAMQKKSYETPSTSSYGHSNKSTSYAVLIFTKADVAECEAKKLEYKRQIAKIEDRLGELNIVGKVKLSEDEVKLLQSHGLV